MDAIKLQILAAFLAMLAGYLATLAIFLAMLAGYLATLAIFLARLAGFLADAWMVDAIPAKLGVNFGPHRGCILDPQGTNVVRKS